MVVTNVQLYLAIGIPMLFNAAMIGLLLAHMNSRFEAADKISNERFAGVNLRFESLIQHFEQRFERVDERFDSLNERFEQRFKRVEERFDSLNGSINERFDAIDRRFDDMRDLWRAELRRVEEVMDARFRLLQER